MEFFSSAINTLQTLVVALGAGLAVWGVINVTDSGYCEHTNPHNAVNKWSVQLDHTRSGEGLITFQTTGVYLIVITTQVSQTAAQTTRIDLWLRKNGVDLPDSNRSRTLTSATDVGSVALSYIVPMAATDNLEIYQSVNNIGRNTGIYALTPAGEPAAPSIIVTIDYIST